MDIHQANMDSDNESDFYGDEVTVKELETRVDDFDTDEWWTDHNIIQTPLKLQSKKLKQTGTAHLHNPYAGVHGAWQLTETIEEFLDRLPPAISDEDKVGQWIFICNPYIDRKHKHDAQNQQVKGCEDEAPEEEGADLMRFCEGGQERLHLVTDFHETLNNATIIPAMRTREKIKAAMDAANDILGLAHTLHIRSGKWMLFCSVHSVNEVWSIIAKATANNELGIAAKVATRWGEDFRTERLICVYTADFADKDDVQRVALKLRQLGLVQPRGKPLYYKPDAYTYLGIGSGNTWNIKASIYNTRDIIGKL